MVADGVLSAMVTLAKTTRTRRRLSSHRNPWLKDGEASGPRNTSSSLTFNVVLLSHILSSKTAASSEEDARRSCILPVNGAVSIPEHFKLQAFFPIVASQTGALPEIRSQTMRTATRIRANGNKICFLDRCAHNFPRSCMNVRARKTPRRRVSVCARGIFRPGKNFRPRNIFRPGTNVRARDFFRGCMNARARDNQEDTRRPLFLTFARGGVAGSGLDLGSVGSASLI